MKVVYFASDKPREIMLARAIEEGLKRAGDTFELRRTSEYGDDAEGNELKYAGPTPDTDVVCMFGAKGKSGVILDDHRLLGIPTLYFDKGYTRTKGEGGHTEYSRISVNKRHPLDYMMREKRPDDRWRALELKLLPRREDTGGPILFCNSSQKYHDFHGLGDATEYAHKRIKELRKLTARAIIYRPKPSDRLAQRIPGVPTSDKNSSILEAMNGVSLVITHGATAAMDAILNGIPAMTLGDSIARPVSETVLEKVETPHWPRDTKLRDWCCAMAYVQWTTQELRDGLAWEHLKAEIKRQR